jgi:DNA-binding cell septation regulator SpoVG
MPSRKYDDNGTTKYSEYFFPVTKEAREEFVGAIMAAYKAALEAAK